MQNAECGMEAAPCATVASAAERRHLRFYPPANSYSAFRIPHSAFAGGVA
jgi:hypothetical protein